ncbi:hypothetical protein [Peredibacter starrii]|uniref:Lipoprotein n=1 Tax=Peredibacter starrii TaxID=28202 RepID=A0AAX4HSX7_9BACT|nr:hypothetical protein [Peredibacter starrii]WPU66377.1 hypothetical protein SOO65_06430 [Peredibacter starrii]
MLHSNQRKTIYTAVHALILMAMFTLYSCLPTATPPAVKSGSTTDPGTGTTPTYSEPTYPLSGIFIQEGAVQSTTNVTLPVSFTDSFLVRGKNLSVYLRTLPNTTKFCMVGKYTYLSGSDQFLILTAKPKSYTDLVAKTTEFYLQVEPSNDTANQNDCLSYNLTNALYANATNPSVHFSLTQVCANCSSTVTSSGLKLYFINGEEVPTLTFSSLMLTLSGSSSSGGGNTCAESSACTARGYDCCLQGACVKDGAVRPGAVDMPGFLAAQEDVKSNPNRFIVYPQYYFVCEKRPEGSTTGSTGGGSTNPDYEAAIRLMELNQLYNCVNKVDGEFSYCTLKYTNASASIPGNFSAGASGYNDDVNFSTLNPNLTGDYANNIVKIIYGGQTLYELNKTALTGATFVSGTANDNLTSSQIVNVTSALANNAQDGNLYLTYKVDGTCSKVGTTLAKCSKTYVQGSSDTYSSTWHDSTKTYLLPSYADVSSTASVIIKVSGVVVPEDTSTWSKYQSPNRIVFNSSYPLYQNQTIEITYFVTSGAADLIKLRTAAQSQVNSMCSCASSTTCNLKPIADTSGAIVNYECTYPTSGTDEPPANQTVYVSNKNVPHRYYDQSGVNYDEDYASAPVQELTAFAYTNNDVLKPTNVSQYTGFNEIYGSFAKSGTYVAKPAKLVKVKKDKQYDILVNSGAFSTCLTCGSDYYNSLQKIFPQNFAGQGGGYAPDIYESRREQNASLYRSDDLLFGRACFVPATMIPWSHIQSSTPRDQRRARLAAQHFLFANGYSRDWYGFDYGSIIGSFDGVTWFSIGNQRRIKATTSKLFLAVNAYYGDMAVDNNFSVTVSETSIYSSEIADHDTETDGAQCQKSHYCSNDNDCFRQLGYDYTCQNVAGITTTWPQFDATGSETIGSTSRTLISIVGGSNGQAKRCMYRGRGAPCLNNLDQAATTTTFNGSPLIGTLTCSPNNSCAPTSTSLFNDRIARFANTPTAQNSAAVATPNSDIVGQGARILGRPFDYYGKTTAPSTARAALTANLVNAVCIPGKDLTNATRVFDLNRLSPSVRTETSDKLFGTGPTMSGYMSSKYLNACPATDAAGNSMQIYDLPMGDTTLNMFTIAQNMSSNLLDLVPLKNLSIFSSTSGSQITNVGYQRNACLRAPGASCFSDMECGPSNFIASKAKSADLSAYINSAEEKYWEEELVCGNPDFKTVSAGLLNPNFDPKKNFCCRELGKTISVFTQTQTSAYQWCDISTKQVKVAGVNMNIATPSRYSRVHTGYDKMTCNADEISSTKAFALSIAATNNDNIERMRQILGQYKTLDAVNSRTCCTQHWVRSFATENGAGHAFAKTKMQNIDKAMFKHISWSADDESSIQPPVNDAAFECDPNQYANASCEIKSLTPTEEDKYLTWAGALELIGIPQVAVKTNDQIFKLVSDTQGPIAAGEPLTDSNGAIVMQKVSTVGSDFVDSSGYNYYSAASYNKFSIGAGQFKKVFSENEFNCCLPSGQEVPDTTVASQCCTGYMANNNNVRRCCLPDFTNLTVYLNRYVSSEGRGLSDSAYDPATGYIKDPGQVKLIAAQKNLCCSGKVMTGVAISQLSIPLTGNTYKPADSLTTTRRFNYRSDEVDNNSDTGSIGSVFDAGVRWNNHVYCVPEGFGE